jgi:hypothetical protein
VKWLLEDPELYKQFVAYVSEHGEKKGEKNITVRSLLKHTNDVIFKMGTPTPLLSKEVSESCVYKWLSRCHFSFDNHEKAQYKDGALDGEVLDRPFNEVIPFWVQKLEEGMLEPRDFDDVTDLTADGGWSEEAYEKARLRAVAYSNDPLALPWLAWSHDEACADSMDGQKRAWVAKGEKRLHSKGNSGKKCMAAEFAAIVGNGTLQLTDAEFTTAKARGYTGPQRALMLMEIGGQDENLSETLETYRGQIEAEGLIYALEAKIDKMGHKELDIALSEHKLVKTGVKAVKAARLCEHLKGDTTAATVLQNDSTVLKDDATYMKGYCTNNHIMVQAEHFTGSPSAAFFFKIFGDIRNPNPNHNPNPNPIPKPFLR